MNIHHQYLVLAALSALLSPLAVAETACPTEDMTELEPIVEHPSGDFRSSLEAMAEAFQRIRKCCKTERWVILSGQGQGWRLDSYLIADVRYRNGEFVFSEAIVEIASLVTKAGLDEYKHETSTDLKAITISVAPPDKLAKFLDILYREHFNIRPHDGEDDYAFGAEWM